MVRQRKEKWRKVVPEVSQVLSKKAQEEAFLEREDLFTVDTQGSLAGLPRSVRKAIAKDPTGSGKKPLSRQEKAKFLKAARSRPQPKKEEPEVFDAWVVEKKEKFTFPIRRVEDESKLGMGRSGLAATSKSPAIIPPDAGHSVNPSQEAFQGLVATAAAVEFEKDRRTELQNRRARPVTALLKEHFEPEQLAAMSEADKQAKYLQLVRGDVVEGGESELPLLKKKAAKKTRAQLNKEARRAALELEMTREKKQKKRDNSIGEVGAIMKEVKTKAQLRAEQKEYAAQKRVEEETEVRAGRLTKAPRVGKHQFVETPLEVVYDAEDRKQIRVAAKVSAIQTCADSYYRRNMLEAKPENSRANARFLQKRVRKAVKANRHIAKEYRDKSLLL